MKPKLITLDLTKCTHKESGYSDHPDIKENTPYLAKIGGQFFAGDFNGWIGHSGLQLDKPGTNASEWEGLWELK